METKDKINKDLGQEAVKTSKSAANGESDEDIEDVPLFRKKRVIIPILLVLIAISVAGYYWYMNMQDFVSTDDAYVDANSVSISTKMLGRIVYLGTDEGDTVKTGQVLVRLDDRDLRAEEASAQAGLQLAEQSVPLAQVQVNRAEDDFNRAEVQYRGGIVTKEQYQHAQQALQAAHAELTIAQSKIPAARAQVGVIEAQLLNTVVTSPTDGVVAKRWVLTGDVVQPGQPVFTIYDLKNIWVTANLEETKLSYVHIGDPVDINVDTYPGMKFFGRVFEMVSYTASEFSLIPPDNASGNFTKVTQRVPIKITIDDPKMPTGGKPVLRPGMSGEVSVRVK